MSRGLGAPLEPDVFGTLVRAGALPRILDLRSRGSWRARHVRGAFSLPESELLASLFLLPPRDQGLCVVHAAAAAAARAAAALAERGWREVAWLDGRTQDLASDLLETGAGRGAPLWEPAPLLKAACRWIDRALPARGGRALDLACGSGRNGVFLAARGWAVTAVDILPDALAQARRVARTVETPAGIRFLQADLTRHDARRRLLAPGAWDLILCFRYLDRSILPEVADALGDAGMLVFETFLEEQGRIHGRPAKPDHLLRPGELRATFCGLTSLAYQEGRRQNGSHLASLVARRGPAS